MNRRTFDILRHEFRALRTRVLNALNPAHHARVAHLRRQAGLKLNIGSGGRGLPGWVNIELKRAGDTTLCLDIRRRLPLKDGSVQWIFIEHVLEHMDFAQDLPRMLADWRRVMAPGGRVRIIVPDVRKYIEAYLSGDPENWRALAWNPDEVARGEVMPMHILNHVFHQEGEHLFGCDFDLLAFALKRAGFSAVEQMDFQRSGDAALAIDRPEHKDYSLYVEAVR